MKESCVVVCLSVCLLVCFVPSFCFVCGSFLFFRFVCLFFGECLLLCILVVVVCIPIFSPTDLQPATSGAFSLFCIGGSGSVERRKSSSRSSSSSCGGG